jgi:hypothetical protein
MTGELPTSSTLVVARVRGRRHPIARLPLAASLLASMFLAVPTLAHHSYSMFDMSTSVVVEGSVAKHEWVNPHTFVWLYVEKKGQPGQHDLYAFENGPIGMMVRQGWSKDTLSVGEKITVQYFPLKDGRTGGYFIKAVFADGREILGDKFAPGVIEASKKTASP